MRSHGHILQNAVFAAISSQCKSRFIAMTGSASRGRLSPRQSTVLPESLMPDSLGRLVHTRIPFQGRSKVSLMASQVADGGMSECVPSDRDGSGTFLRGTLQTTGEMMVNERGAI